MSNPTTRSAMSTSNHIVGDSGSRNARRLGSLRRGFRYRILTPRLMNGFVNRTTFSRSYVMVRGATAASTLCGKRKWLFSMLVFVCLLIINWCYSTLEITSPINPSHVPFSFGSPYCLSGTSISSYLKPRFFARS